MATPNGRADPAAVDGGPYIPAELIPDIAKHLTSLNDFFGLRTCCRAYRAALPLRRDLLAAQPPCLLVPHSSSPSLNLFALLEPASRASFSLALFHLPDRRLHRLRARLPFSRTGGVLTSDGAQVAAVDAATGEVLVTRLLSGAQARLPKPPLPHNNRLILTSGLVFAPAAGTTHVQYCRPWSNPAAQWTVAAYGGHHEIHDWRVVNGALYGLLPTCGLVMASLPKDGNMELWLLGGELDVHIIQAMQESRGAMLLGDCGGDLVLIFKVGSIDPAYKIFLWDAGEGNWRGPTSLGGCALFLGFDDFAACIGPDLPPGIRGDCVYGSLPWAGGWSEYSIADDSCKCITAKYPGEPRVGFQRPQVWVLPSLGFTN